MSTAPILDAECSAPLTEVPSVLIVDDGVDDLNLAYVMFKPAGYRVMSALSGELALRAVETHLPDLVLLDVRMPGMDGYATCRELKAHERTRDIPVIFISASPSLADRIAAFAAGGVDYVTKPFCQEEVLARVHTHVQFHRQRLHLEELVAIRTKKLSESEANLLELSNHLQRVREEDRTHFARELHDELGQNMTALRIECNALAKALPTAPPTIKAKLDSMDKMIEDTLNATRRICEDMRPGMLDDLGLEAALSHYAKQFTTQHGVACDLSMDRQNYGLDEPLSTAIYRLVQEGLTNIARHANASYALISLEDRGDEIMLTIADDGCGISVEPDNDTKRKHYGLLGMRERVQLLHGHIFVDSAAGRGTHIEVKIPKRRLTEQLS